MMGGGCKVLSNRRYKERMDKLKVKLYNEDCTKVLKEMKDESVDLVCSDIPYLICQGGCSKGIGKDGLIHQSFGGGGILSKVNPHLPEERKRTGYCPTGGYYLEGTKHITLGGVLDDNDPTTYTKQGKLFKHNDIKFSDYLPDLYRVLKPTSHCYLMINARNMNELWNECLKVGFTFQQLLVWNKGNACPNKYYMNALEYILMFRKGNAKNINNMGTPNILTIDNITGNKLHATEKPVELMEILIKNSTKENEIVLDPFMGCGSTGEASVKNGRKFIGIEIDEKYFSIADKILNQGISRESLRSKPTKVKKEISYENQAMSIEEFLGVKI